MELLVEDGDQPLQTDQPLGGRRYGIVTVVHVEARRSTVDVKKPELYHGLEKGQIVVVEDPEGDPRDGTE